jgi:hypothetical protein
VRVPGARVHLRSARTFCRSPGRGHPVGPHRVTRDLAAPCDISRAFRSSGTPNRPFDAVVGFVEMLTELDQTTMADITSALDYVCKQLPADKDSHATRKQIADAMVARTLSGRRSLDDLQTVGLRVLAEITRPPRFRWFGLGRPPRSRSIRKPRRIGSGANLKADPGISRQRVR